MVKNRKKPLESKFKKEHLYLILFVVLGLFFLSLIGFNSNNQISGAVSIGGTIKNALGIFTEILTPLFQAIGEDQNAVFLRVFYWLFLFFIISGVEGLRKKFGADETGVKRANIIAGLIALVAVVFTPVEFLILIGNSVFLIVVIGCILGGLYWIYNHQRNAENRFTYFVKAFASFVLFLLIGTASSYASTKFSSTFGAGSIFDTVLSLGALISILFFFWYLFIKTLIGGPTEQNEGSPPSRQLREAGGFYGGAVTGAGGGAKGLFSKIFGKKTQLPQQNLQSNQPPEQQQTTQQSQQQRPQRQRKAQQQQAISVEDELRRNNTAAIMILNNNFIRGSRDIRNWNALSAALNNVINSGRKVKRINLANIIRDFQQFEVLRQKKSRDPKDQSIDRNGLNLARNILGDLVNIERAL